MNGAELLASCKDALAGFGEANAELFVRTRRRGAARFALGELGQHMAFHETEVAARVAYGKRVAESSGDAVSRAELLDLLARTAALAKRAPEVDGFTGFADAGPETPAVPRFAAATDALTDDERAAIVARSIERIAREGLVATGILETETQSIAVATPNGCARSHDGTIADFRVWALEDAAGRGASGNGSDFSRDVSALAVERATEDAIRIAKDSRNARGIDAGTWDVVLGAEGVGELLSWLGMIAPAAPEVEQGKSPLAGKIGQRVTGEAISIVEDPLATHLGAVAPPFDREGTVRSRVDIVEHGVARGILYDRTYGARAGAESTGSAVTPAFGAGSGVGPVALTLEGGSAESEEELVSGMARGLYVRRLHYVNGFLDPPNATMTGLTRDGCFLVEDGRIVAPVRNARLTDQFLAMLARADALTTHTPSMSSLWTPGGNISAPSVRFRGVRFTSGSRAEP